MPDYRRDTGTSGTLIIRDYGNNVEFLIENRSGSTFANGKGWSGTINGTNVGGTYSISGVQTISVGMWWVTNAQDVIFSIGASNTQGLGGPTSFQQWIPRGSTPPPQNIPPSQPPLPVFQSATQATLTFGIGNPNTWGTGTPLTFEHQVAIDDFVTILQQWQYPSSPVVVGGLAAGQAYRYRYRAVSTVGPGAWSYGLMATTLPTTAPGMVVLPTVSGVSASVTLTPPSGFSGVTSYTVEYRPGGTTAATQVTGPSPIVVSGLTPGAVYEWRSRANFGSIFTDWTAWIPVEQPRPNTSPGDYFDGNTPDTADSDYQWTGAQNNSTSIVVGIGLTGVGGWLSFADGTPNAQSGSLARITGGLYGSFGARVTFTTDQTIAGFTGGTAIADPGRVDVTPNATYVGSLYVNPSKTNLFRPRLAWISALGAVIGTSDGTVVTAPAGQWTRLVVTGTAPAGAEYAAIWWVAPAEGSLWLAGDTVLMDGAMVTLGTLIPYFDGSFPDVGGFAYEWLGTTNASVSMRSDVPADVSDALIDPDCPPVPAPPRPPVVLDECIDEVGVWRRYLAVIPATEVSDWLDVLPTFTLTTLALAERQVRIRIYPNPFEYQTSQVDTTSWCGEQIISYVPPNTTMTLDGEIQRVFASVAGGATQAADHLLYGTGGTPATWPILTCGISYLVSFDTPLDAPAGNTSVAVDLTRRSY